MYLKDTWPPWLDPNEEEWQGKPSHVFLTFRSGKVRYYPMSSGKPSNGFKEGNYVIWSVFLRITMATVRE